MRLHSVSLVVATALGLSACVIVDPLPVTGPSVNGVPTAVPTAPTNSLASVVGGGRAYVNTKTGQRMNLWSDGTYTVSFGNQQSFGTWRSVELPVSMCFTGPVAAYAGGACVRVRFDGDFLELYDLSGSFAVEAWAVAG